jgi:hypothetical protein
LFRNREGTHKSNASTSYVWVSLIKTVNRIVLKSKYDRKVSDEMVNVVEDSGEGRFFLKQGDARKF